MTADAAAMEELLGSHLMTNVSTRKETAVALEKGKKLIALYFSANWCPPCQAFGPLLKQFYNSVDDLEIVYIPYDNNIKEFKKYYGGMPWLAVGFEDSAKIKSNLEKAFKIEGIPSFIVLESATGKFVTIQGQNGISAAAKKGGDACQKMIEKWLAIPPVPVEEANLSTGGCCLIL